MTPLSCTFPRYYHLFTKSLDQSGLIYHAYATVSLHTICEVPSFTRSKDMDEDSKRKIGIIWGGVTQSSAVSHFEGHSRSLEMAPFDTTFYLPSIVTLSLSCAVFQKCELFFENLKFCLSQVYLAPLLGVILGLLEVHKFFGIRKLRVARLHVLWCCLRNGKFSRFDVTSACDRQIDR